MLHLRHAVQYTRYNIQDTIYNIQYTRYNIQGRIQDFKIGGAHLKKLRRAEGGAKKIGVFRVKKHDFTPKNQFFPIAEGGAIFKCAPPLT
jgi:hypothetical protein